jgi:viroplasmin and RNaseH domain-containing protein
MGKFYAVKSGYKIGIFTEVNDFNKSMSGYSGAMGQVCKTEDEAIFYLYGAEGILKKYAKKEKRAELNKESGIHMLDESLEDALEYAKVLRDFFQLVEKKFSQLHNKVHSTDLELSNLIHELEFGNLTDEQKLDNSNKTEQKRKERRYYKDTKDKFEVLYKLIQKYDNMKFDLQTTIENIFIKDESLKTRKFTNRESVA